MWKWDDGKIGKELNNQVILGTGFPKVSQINCTEEPNFTVWSNNPVIAAGAPVGKK